MGLLKNSKLYNLLNEKSMNKNPAVAQAKNMLDDPTDGFMSTDKAETFLKEYEINKNFKMALVLIDNLADKMYQKQGEEEFKKHEDQIESVINYLRLVQKDSYLINPGPDDSLKKIEQAIFRLSGFIGKSPRDFPHMYDEVQPLATELSRYRSVVANLNLPQKRSFADQIIKGVSPGTAYRLAKRYSADVNVSGGSKLVPTKENQGKYPGDDNYTYYVENDQWYAYNTTTKKTTNLSENPKYSKSIERLNKHFGTDIKSGDQQEVDINLVEGPDYAKTAILNTKVYSKGATRVSRIKDLAKKAGVPESFMYAQEVKESYSNPSAFAWNLHIARNNKYSKYAGAQDISESDIERMNKATLKFPHEKTSSGGASFYGKNARNAFIAAYEVNPWHAIAGGAWGFYQVLGAYILPLYGNNPEKFITAFNSNPGEFSKKAFLKWITLPEKSGYVPAANKGDFVTTTSLYYGSAKTPGGRKYVEEMKKLAKQWTKEVSKFQIGDPLDYVYIADSQGLSGLGKAIKKKMGTATPGKNFFQKDGAKPSDIMSEFGEKINTAVRNTQNIIFTLGGNGSDRASYLAKDVLENAPDSASINWILAPPAVQPTSSNVFVNTGKPDREVDTYKATRAKFNKEITDGIKAVENKLGMQGRINIIDPYPWFEENVESSADGVHVDDAAGEEFINAIQLEIKSDAYAMKENYVISESNLRRILIELLEDSKLSSKEFQERAKSRKLTYVNKQEPGRGIDKSYFKFKLVDGNKKLLAMFGLTEEGDFYYLDKRKKSDNSDFVKLNENTFKYYINKAKTKCIIKEQTSPESEDIIKNFLNIVTLPDEQQAPGISTAIANIESRGEESEKLSREEEEDAKRNRLLMIYPEIEKIINPVIHSKTGKLLFYLKGDMVNKLNAQHKELGKSLQDHLQKNGFPKTTIEGGYGGRDLEAAAATDNPDRIPGSLHGFHMAVDFKINCPEAGVNNYRENTDGKKGTANNPTLAKNSDLVKQIDAFTKKQSEYRWGGNYGKSDPVTGTVDGRGIKEFHHFEIVPTKLTSYIDATMQKVLDLYDFKESDIKSKEKRSSLFDRMAKDFKEGKDKVKGQTSQKKTFVSNKKKSKKSSKG